MTLTWQHGWRYGLLGFGLAFVALPLYVLLPHYYASAFGVPLASLGGLLLGARLLDALIDPLLGRWSDGLFARALPVVLRWAALAALGVALGFALLLYPPIPTSMSPSAGNVSALLTWAAACLVLTYTAYSALGIVYQSWGAMLGGDAAQRSRVVAWREGFGIAGVVCASVLPTVAGLGATVAVLWLALAAGVWAWSRGLRPAPQTPQTPQTATSSSLRNVARSLGAPFKRPGFTALFAVFMVNGTASAIPATLVLFFIQDRLQASAAQAPLFLALYFVAAALSIALWLRLVPVLGLARAWGLGMVLAVVVFVWAGQLGAGDGQTFMVVCALSGVALGADLVLPSAMLAGMIQHNGDQGRAEGAYMGWWNFANKLNLALAAGLALPALAWLGYTPGTQDEQGLRMLSAIYCWLPCGLKLLAAGMLGIFIRRRTV